MRKKIQKLFQKKFLYVIPAVLAAVVFLLLPLPDSNLYLCVEFDETSANIKNCRLYYTTAASSEYFSLPCLDEGNNSSGTPFQARFRIEPSVLSEQITSLRLDLPDLDQIVCVKSVTVSSAGIIKREFNPCYFFSDPNIVSANSITERSLLPFRRIAYIATAADDPYLVFSDTLVREISDCSGNYVWTRLLICLFPVILFFSYRKKIFTADIGQQQL